MYNLLLYIINYNYFLYILYHEIYYKVYNKNMKYPKDRIEKNVKCETIVATIALKQTTLSSFLIIISPSALSGSICTNR